MPLLSIETNAPLANDSVLKELSQAIASILGKPESYVMIKYQHTPHMLFAGTNEPLAYLQLKSLGLPDDQTSDFSAALCEVINKLFSVPAERIYIEFSNPKRHMWGWNNATF